MPQPRSSAAPLYSPHCDHSPSATPKWHIGSIVLSLKYRFHIRRIGAKIELYIPWILGVPRTLYHQPSAPTHLIQHLLHLSHIDGRIILQPYPIRIRTMYLADIVLSQCPQLLIQITLRIQGIGKIEIDPDTRRSDVLQKLYFFRGAERGLDANDDARLLYHLSHYL